MLVIQCDECLQRLYEWKDGLDIQQKAVTDLFRVHLCRKCQDIEQSVKDEMEEWDKKYMEKYNAERDKRVLDIKTRLKK